MNDDARRSSSGHGGKLCPDCGALMDLEGRSVNARWVCPFDSQIVWAIEHGVQ